MAERYVTETEKFAARRLTPISLAAAAGHLEHLERNARESNYKIARFIARERRV